MPRGATRNAAKTSTNGKGSWTKARLERLAENDRPGLYAVAAEYGIHPGRGITTTVMVRRILEASGGEPGVARVPAKRAATKQVPAKRAAQRTKKAVPKRAAPKRVAAKRAPGSTRSRDSEAAKRFIETAAAALEVARSLL